MQQNLDYVDCIEKITKKLKTHKGLYNVFPITTAKVPIIKFKHRRSQLEGDISLYNLLVEIFHRFISKQIILALQGFFSAKLSFQMILGHLYT